MGVRKLWEGAADGREGYQQDCAERSVTDYPLTVRHVDGRLTSPLGSHAGAGRDTVQTGIAQVLGALL